MARAAAKSLAAVCDDDKRRSGAVLRNLCLGGAVAVLRWGGRGAHGVRVDVVDAGGEEAGSQLEVTCLTGAKRQPVASLAHPSEATRALAPL